MNSSIYLYTIFPEKYVYVYKDEYFANFINSAIIVVVLAGRTAPYFYNKIKFELYII